MLSRQLSLPLHRAMQSGGVVVLEGPRGAGKTTLALREYPAHTYVNLQEYAVRQLARQDPSRFLARLRGPAILDEVQRAPELLAFLAAQPDQPRLLLLSPQRLALPLPTCTLYPPTRAERLRRPPLPLAQLGRFAPEKPADGHAKNHPPKNTVPPAWPTSTAFVTLDLPHLVAVRQQEQFLGFLASLPAHSGQLLDKQALARENQLSHRTVVRWLNVLHRCFAVALVPASELTLGRRTLRAPRLHVAGAPNFATQVYWELLHTAHHTATPIQFTHWQDSNGFGIPLLLEREGEWPVPIGLAEEATPTGQNRLERWMQLAGTPHGAWISNLAPAQLAKARRTKGGALRYSLSEL